jgi:Ca2+-transporting ATPase
MLFDETYNYELITKDFYDLKYFSVKNIGKRIKDKVMIAIIVGTILGVGVILYSPINTYLKLAPLSLTQALLVILIAFVSVFWYEIVKLINKIRKD